MRTSPRRQLRVAGMGAILTVVVALLLSLPVAGLVTLLLGASHAADPRVPALGVDAVYPLVVAAWCVGWLVRTDVRVS